MGIHVSQAPPPGHGGGHPPAGPVTGTPTAQGKKQKNDQKIVMMSPKAGTAVPLAGLHSFPQSGNRTAMGQVHS